MANQPQLWNAHTIRESQEIAPIPPAVDGTPLDEVGPSDRWVLCIGAEERGLRAKTRSQVDEFVAIPMADEVESLNLSVSAGILLWELSKPKP